MSREKLTSTDSRTLCERLRQGHQDAFVALYNYCERIVVPIVRRGYSGHDLNGDIDEILQETILRIYKVIGVTRDYDESIENFVGLVALGKWRDLLRRQNVYKKHIDRYSEEYISPAEGEDDNYIREQFDTLMAVTAKQLPRCHPLFVLYYELETPIKDIAERFDTSPNNISSKLKYCRKRLLEKLENLGHDRK